MLFIERVVVCTSCFAAIAEISKFMDMDAMFAIWIESFDRTGYFSGRFNAVLTEGCYSFGVGVVGIEDTDGVSFGVWGLGLVKEEERCKGCRNGKGKGFSEHIKILVIEAIINSGYCQPFRKLILVAALFYLVFQRIKFPRINCSHFDHISRLAKKNLIDGLIVLQRQKSKGKSQIV